MTGEASAEDWTRDSDAALREFWRSARNNQSIDPGVETAYRMGHDAGVRRLAGAMDRAGDALVDSLLHTTTIQPKGSDDAKDEDTEAHV